MNLTEHFAFEELTRTDSGLPNIPGAVETANLQTLADALEEVRGILGGKPIHIDSAYRCDMVNLRVGGTRNSAHLKGLAADFVCPSFGTTEDICYALIDARVKFDQLINSRKGTGKWVHFSVAPAMRGQALTEVDGKLTPGLHHE